MVETSFRMVHPLAFQKAGGTVQGREVETKVRSLLLQLGQNMEGLTP